MKKIIGGVIIFTTMFFLPSIVNAAPANPAFTNDAFYSCVVNAYNRENDTDYGYDTNLTDEQLATIKELQCNNIEDNINYPNLTNMTGVEKLTGLGYVSVIGTDLMSADLSQNPNVHEIHFKNNNLKTININKNLIRWVEIAESQLEHLDLSNASNLYYVELWTPSLKSLDVHSTPGLKRLYVYDGPLTSLNLNGTTSLEELDLWNTNLPSLDLSANSSLRTVNFVNNIVGSYNFGTGESLASVGVALHAGEKLDLRSLPSLKELNLLVDGVNEESIVALNPGVNVIVWNITDEAYFNSLIQSMTNPDIISDNGDGGFITVGKGTSLITLEDNSTFRLLVGEGELDYGTPSTPGGDTGSSQVDDTIENPNTGVDEYTILIVMGVVIILGGSIYYITKKKSMFKTM